MKNLKTHPFVMAFMLLPLLYSFDFMFLCNSAPSTFMDVGALRGLIYVPVKLLISIVIAVLFIKGITAKTDRPGKFEVTIFLLLFVHQVPVVGIFVEGMLVLFSEKMTGSFYMRLNVFLFLVAAVTSFLVARYRQKMLAGAIIAVSCIITILAFAKGGYHDERIRAVLPLFGPRLDSIVSVEIGGSMLVNGKPSMRPSVSMSLGDKDAALYIYGLFEDGKYRIINQRTEIGSCRIRDTSIIDITSKRKDIYWVTAKAEGETFVDIEYNGKKFSKKVKVLALGSSGRQTRGPEKPSAETVRQADQENLSAVNAVFDYIQKTGKLWGINEVKLNGNEVVLIDPKRAYKGNVNAINLLLGYTYQLIEKKQTILYKFKTIQNGKPVFIVQQITHTPGIGLEMKKQTEVTITPYSD